MMILFLFFIIMNVIKKEFDDIIARHPAKIPIIIQVDKELSGECFRLNITCL